MPSEIDPSQRCSYVLPKKKRSCRMLTKPGQIYCGEHAIFDPENQDRIPCPNDPKHTVLRQELDEHLKSRCNSRLQERPWIREDINVDKSCSSINQDANPPSEELLRVVANTIIEEYKNVENLVEERFLKTSLLEDSIRADEKALGSSKIKHLKQLSSIIGYLLQFDLISPETENPCIIELGSGKAQLCYWLTKILPKCKFLLVDRSGARNKRENRAFQENPELEITRLRCSVENLDLSNVEFLKKSPHVVAVCKHFCGAATDFGIRCIANAISSKMNMKGFVLTPCCHHRCEYSQYVGRDYLKSIGISDKCSFDALRHISTWATCGFQRPDEKKVSHNNWSIPQKEELGRMAKVLLEIGRIRYLESLGFGVKLYRYTEFSLESLLILGKKVE